MKRYGMWTAVATIVLLLASVAGYRLGRRQPSVVMAATTNKSEPEALYFRNPMGLPDTSPVPKKDAMGMDYIPVYADDLATAGQVRISLDKVQKLGVRTEPVAARELRKTVRAVGQFQFDERRLHIVTARFDGYIEKLYANANGQPIGLGQPLMEVYSPDLVSAQEEYLLARNGREALKQGTEESQVGGSQLADSALKRLRNWNISEAQLQRLQREGKSTRTLTLYSPATGVVMERTAVQGMRFMPGEALLKIADLSTIWLTADVFEQDLALVQVGQTVKISVNAYPGKELDGRIAFVYPTVTPETRTGKIRVELANPGGRLRPDMYASVQLISGNQTKVLAVPDSAVIDSGTRQVVLVQLGAGLFQSREVKLGRRGDEYVEVLEGLEKGENVAIRANFLIDAESNLKAALDSFGSADANRSKSPGTTIPTPPTSAGDKAH